MRARSLVLFLALLASLLVPSEAGAICDPQDPLLQEEFPDVLFDPEIRAAAATLNFEPARIFEWVRNTFEYEPYYGLLRGPLGAVSARAGNDYDLAALLVSLLRVSEDQNGDCLIDPGEDLDGDGVLDGGTRARFVRGRISVASNAAQQWTTSEDSSSPSGPQRHWAEVEPPAWASVPGIGASYDSGSDRVEKLHIWVEAEVSLARYRGAGDPGATHSWIPLDPSYKRRELRPGLDIQAVGFDKRTYYEEIGHELPLEIFRRQVRDHLAQVSPGMSLSDVPRVGPIVPQRAGVLPNALPYDLATSITPTRDASLGPLHEPTKSPAPEAGTQGATDYRWGVKVLECAPGSCATPVIDYLEDAAAWVGKRVTINYPSSNPTLYVDGQSQEQGTASGQNREIRLSVIYPLVGETIPKVHPANWSSNYALAVSGIWSSEALVRRAGEELLDNLDIYPLQGPGAVNLQTDFVAQEALVGGVLHLAAATYFERLERSTNEILELHHRRRVPDLWIGIVQGGPSLDTVFDATFVVRPSQLMLDVQTTLLRIAPSGDAVIGTTPAMELVAFQLSALEHDVWEELIDAEAISTVKGIRINHQQADNRALVIESLQEANDATAYCGTTNFIQQGQTPFSSSLQQSTECPSTGPGALSPESYCEIKSMWAPAAELKSTVDLFVTDPQTGDVVGVVTESTVNNPFWGLFPPNNQPINFRHWKSLFWDAYVCPVYTVASGHPEFALKTPPHVPISLQVPAVNNFTYLDFTGSVFGRALEIAGVGGYGMLIEPSGSQGSFSLGPIFDFADHGVLYNGTFTAFEDIAQELSTSEFAYVDTLLELEPDLFSLNSPLTSTGALGLMGTSLVGDPVSVATGNLHHEEVDVTIAGPGGLPLVFARAYNSRLDYDGGFGYGWTHTYDQHLRIESNPGEDQRLILVDAQGGETPFDDPNPSQTGPRTGPEWSQLQLVREADGSYTLTDKFGGIRRFSPFGTFDPARAYLSEIEDRNGNTFWVSWGDGFALYGLSLGTVLVSVRDGADRTLGFDYSQNGNDTIITMSDYPACAESFPDPPTCTSERSWEYTIRGGNLRHAKDASQVALGASGLDTDYRYLDESGSPLDRNLYWIRLPEGQIVMEFQYNENDTVASHTNASGETTYFDYNFFRRRTRVVFPDGAVETYHFDSFGQVVAWEDGRGFIREYAYDPVARDRELEIDALGFRTQAEYDAQGNLTKRIDRLGHEESWVYNPFSQVLAHTDKRGRETRFDYDANGNLLRVWAELEGELRLLREHEYDAFGNVTRTTEHVDKDGNGDAVTTFQYSSDGADLLRIQDALGNITRITPDVLGRPTVVETSRKIEARVEQIRVTTEYDANDRTVATTDPAGLRRETVYDADGKVNQIGTIVPLPGPDPPVLRVDVTNEYDLAGRLAKTTNALGDSTRFEYDARGRVLKTVTPLGHVTEQVFDAAGNRVRLIDPVGAETEFRYDPENRLVRSIDALGQVSTVSYDAAGRVLETRGPGNRLLSKVVSYDESGNPTLIEDALGRQVQIDYDDLGRKVLATGPLGEPEETATKYAYDLHGRLLAKTEAVGFPEERTTTLTYDRIGRLTQTEDALGRRTGLVYDEIGNLVERINGAGERLRMKYDARGNLLERSGPGVADSYRYDERGRMTLATNPDVTRTFQYDALDRAVSMFDAQFGTARRTFDRDGRVQQAVYPDRSPYGFASGAVVSYVYDARDLVVAIVDPAAGVWQLEYDALGRPVQRTDPTGVTRKVGYDPEGFISSVTAAASNYTETTTYSDYDSLGNPLEIQTAEGTTRIGYDARSRVQSVVYQEGQPGEQSESFGYDRRGNRITHTDRSGVALTYHFDIADQLFAVRDAATSEDVRTFGYDGAGRRVSEVSGGTTKAFGYDALSRLTSMELGGSSLEVELAYDAVGMRYRRSEAGAADSIYFGEWIEHTAGTSRRLVHLSGLDQVIADVTESGEQRALLRDGTANVTHVAVDGQMEEQAGSGALAARRYEAFGSLRAGTASTERGFAGRPIEHAAFGLINFRARHYDPSSGVFVQSDPLGIDAPDLYAYGRNSPYAFIDPTGFDPTAIRSGVASLSGSSSYPTFSSFARDDGVPPTTSPQPSSPVDHNAILNAGVSDVLSFYGLPPVNQFPKKEGAPPDPWAISYRPDLEWAGEVDRHRNEIYFGPDAFLGGREGLRSTAAHEFQHVFDRTLNRSLIDEGLPPLPLDEDPVSPGRITPYERVYELRAYATELRYGSALGVPAFILVGSAERFAEHYRVLNMIENRLADNVLRLAPLLVPSHGTVSR